MRKKFSAVWISAFVFMMTILVPESDVSYWKVSVVMSIGTSSFTAFGSSGSLAKPKVHPVSAEVRSTPDIPRAAALALNFFLITIPPVISGQRVLSFVLCNRSSNRLLSLSLS